MSEPTVLANAPNTSQVTPTKEVPNGSTTQIRKLKYQLPKVRTTDDFLFDSTKIGEGTYGTVFRAKDKSSGEVVALKQIRISQNENGLPITAVREIKLLKSLRHIENIVALKDVVLDPLSKRGSQTECIYLVFEYMEHDLSGLSKTMGSRFIDGQICCYIKQLLEGLYVCHKKNILHRDIKGANLLINKEGVLKLADFGLARKTKEDPRYTAPVVTLWYRSPELLLGTKIYDASIDMWSVGCLLVELYTLQPLFPGTTESEQISRIFEICGTPEHDNWPRGREMPYYRDMKPKETKPRILKDYVKQKVRSKSLKITDEALDLIDELLSLDPSKRPTAEKALDHRYFFTPPLLESSQLPKYSGSHNELSSKRSRESVRQEPIPKRPRYNERPPYRDERRYPPQRRHDDYPRRQPFGNRNPEYVPHNRNNYRRHTSHNGSHDPHRGSHDPHRGSHDPHRGSHDPHRRYSSNDSRDRQPPPRREPAVSTHAAPPRDYREQGLSPQ